MKKLTRRRITKISLEKSEHTIQIKTIDLTFIANLG